MNRVTRDLDDNENEEPIAGERKPPRRNLIQPPPPDSNTRTLDLALRAGFEPDGERLDSSGPPSTAPPPLPEVPPLQDSGVLGLALAAGFLPLTVTGFERRCRPLHASVAAALFITVWLSPNSISTTMESSSIAAFTQSSPSLDLPALRLRFLLSFLQRLCPLQSTSLVRHCITASGRRRFQPEARSVTGGQASSPLLGFTQNHTGYLQATP
nr:hypothetical protein Iba_chr03bCG1760 [Ipomoea batatas]